MLEVVARRGRADGRRRRPRGARAAATVVGAPYRRLVAGNLRRSCGRRPAGCCGCGVCGAHAGALDRAIGNGEEEIREDSKERGRGNSPEIAAGAPPCLRVAARRR